MNGAAVPWQWATLPITGYTQLRFKGIKKQGGYSQYGFMAIDSVTLIGGPGTDPARVRLTDCSGNLIGEVEAFGNGVHTTVCLPSASNMTITTVSGSTDWVLDINGTIIEGAAVIDMCPDCAGINYPDSTSTSNECGVCQATAASCAGVNTTDGSLLGNACRDRFLKPFEDRNGGHCCAGAYFNFRAMDSWGDGWNNAAVTFAQCNGSAIGDLTEITVANNDPRLAPYNYEGSDNMVCLKEFTAYKVDFTAAGSYPNEIRYDFGAGTALQRYGDSACIDSANTTNCGGAWSTCDCTGANQFSPLQTYTRTTSATIDGQVCTLATGATQSCAPGDAGCAAVSGCTDSTAANYLSTANVDDGSCVGAESCFGNRTDSCTSCGYLPSSATTTMTVTSTTGSSSNPSCIVDSSGCVTDGQGNYGQNERCTITVGTAGRVTATQFNIEGGNYDYLTIAGTAYRSRYSAPTNVAVSAGATISWSSDGSLERGGFRLCPSAAPAGPMPIYNQILKRQCSAANQLAGTYTSKGAAMAACNGNSTCTGILHQGCSGNTFKLCTNFHNISSNTHCMWADKDEAPFESDLYISHLVDPSNDPTARFIQIFNPSPTATVSLVPYSLRRWTNGNTYFTASTLVRLSGSLAPKGMYTLCRSSSSFSAAYANNSNFASIGCDRAVGSGGVGDSDGDDQIQLLKNDVVIDTFGVPGQDGTGTNHDFENGEALRTVPGPTKTYNASDWTIASPYNVAPLTSTANMTVTAGASACQIDSNGCATDGSGDYGNNERCTITVTTAGAVTATQYTVQTYYGYKYDYLTIAGTQYRYSAPTNVAVSVGDTISWYSGNSGNGAGFTLCPRARTLPSVSNFTEPTC
jgi:hypothetical protein